MQAYLYDGYWEDIGTIEAFYNANLGITDKEPKFRYTCSSALLNNVEASLAGAVQVYINRLFLAVVMVCTSHDSITYHHHMTS